MSPNSCYMASVLQTLFSIPAFQDRYYRRPSPDLSQNYASESAAVHWATCSQALPADCLECQLFKLADGLLSGRYSHPHTEERTVDYFLGYCSTLTPIQHPWVRLRTLRQNTRHGRLGSGLVGSKHSLAKVTRSLPRCANKTQKSSLGIC